MKLDETFPWGKSKSEFTVKSATQMDVIQYVNNVGFSFSVENAGCGT